MKKTSQVLTFVCQRCGHGSEPGHPWIPRRIDPSGNVVPPKVCPKCKSAWYDKPRIAKAKKK